MLKAASDDDKTIRYQAAELLSLLHDQRAIPESIKAVRETVDDNKARNQLIITRESAVKLTDEKKSEILKEINRVPLSPSKLLGSSQSIQKVLGW